MLWPDLNEQELARLAPYADQVFGARKARRDRFLEFGCTAPNIAGELQAVLPQGERRNKQQVHFHAGVQQQRQQQQQQQQLQQQSTPARRRQRKLLESFDPDAMKHAMTSADGIDQSELLLTYDNIIGHKAELGCEDMPDEKLRAYFVAFSGVYAKIKDHQVESTVYQITLAAMKAMLAYPHAFVNGIHGHQENSLPHGFFLLRKTIKIEGDLPINVWVLAYDPQQAQKATLSPLVPVLMKLPEYQDLAGLAALTVDIEPTEDSYVTHVVRDMAYRKLYDKSQIEAGFFALLGSLYPDDSQQALLECVPFLQSLSDANYKKFMHLFLEVGPEAVNYVVRQLQTLSAIELQHFMACFVDPVPSIFHLATPDLSDKLIELKDVLSKANEATWWHGLVDAHVEHCDGQVDFIVLMNAFTAFKQKLEEISHVRECGRLTLPLNFKFENVKHMQVALQRIVYLLETSPDPREQLTYLEGLDLAVLGAVYARSHPHHTNLLAAQCMQLSVSPRVCLPVNTIACGNATNLATVLMNIASISRSFRFTRINSPKIAEVFAYIGVQQFRAPFNDYVQLYHDICSKTYIEDDVAADSELKVKVFALTVKLTSGPSNYHRDLHATCARVLNGLRKLSTHKQNQIINFLVYLFDVGIDFCEWLTAQEDGVFSFFHTFVHAFLKYSCHAQLNQKFFQAAYKLSEQDVMIICLHLQVALRLLLGDIRQDTDLLAQASDQQLVAQEKFHACLALFACDFSSMDGGEFETTWLPEWIKALEQVPHEMRRELLTRLVTVDIKQRGAKPSLVQVMTITQAFATGEHTLDELFAEHCPTVVFDVQQDDAATQEISMQRNLNLFQAWVKETLTWKNLGSELAKVSSDWTEGSFELEVKEVKRLLDQPELSVRMQAVRRCIKLLDTLPFGIKQAAQKRFKSQIVAIFDEPCKQAVTKFQQDGGEDYCLQESCDELQRLIAHCFAQAAKAADYFKPVGDMSTALRQLIARLQEFVNARYSIDNLVVALTSPNCRNLIVDAPQETVDVIVTLLNVLHRLPVLQTDAVFAQVLEKTPLVIDDLRYAIGILTSFETQSLPLSIVRTVFNHTQTIEEQEARAACINVVRQLVLLLSKNIQPCANALYQCFLQADGESIILFEGIVAQALAVLNIDRDVTVTQLPEDSQPLADDISTLLQRGLKLDVLQAALDFVQTQYGGLQQRQQIMHIFLGAFRGVGDEQIGMEVVSGFLEQVKSARVDLAAVYALYQHAPMPGHERLLSMLGDDFADQAKKYAKDPQGNRDLAEQFNTRDIERVARGVKTLQGDALPRSLQDKLIQRTLYVNALGHDPKCPLMVDGVEPKPACELDDSEIQAAMAKIAELLRAETTSDATKLVMRLQAIAILREVMFRTQPENKIPNSTQVMACVMSQINTPTNLLQQIDTGEGKGITSALLAMLAWLEDASVDVLTSDALLSERDQQEFSDFFYYLNVPCAYVTAEAEEGTYQVGGVNFATVSAMAMYRSHAKVRRESMRRDKQGNKRPVSAIIDEGDKTALDDKTPFNLAMNLSETQDDLVNAWAWVYSLVLDFIKTEQFLDESALITDDSLNLRRYLLSHAFTDEQRQQVEDADAANYITDDDLIRWTDAALQVQSGIEQGQLLEGRDFVIREADRDEYGQSVRYSYAMLLDDACLAPASRWKDSVHQFVHAYFNKEYEEDIRAGCRRPFVMEPETSHVATQRSIDLIDYYNTKGRLQMLSATMGGSDGERVDLASLSKARGFVMPSHNVSLKQDLGFVVADDERGQLKELKSTVRKSKKHCNRQPILMIAKDINEAKHLRDELNAYARRQGYTVQVVRGDEPFDEFEELMKVTGRQGMLTIATPAMTRGKNPKAEEVVEEYGLLEINVNFFRRRAEKQARGRPARYGAAGQVKTVLSWQQFCEEYGEYLSAEDKRARGKHREVVMRRVQDRLDSEALQLRQIEDGAAQLLAQCQRRFDRWYKFLVGENEIPLNDKEFLQLKENFLRQAERFWQKQVNKEDWQQGLESIPNARLYYLGQCQGRYRRHLKANWETLEGKIRERYASKLTLTEKLGQPFAFSRVDATQQGQDSVPALPPAVSRDFEESEADAFEYCDHSSRGDDVARVYTKLAVDAGIELSEQQRTQLELQSIAKELEQPVLMMLRTLALTQDMPTSVVSSFLKALSRLQKSMEFGERIDTAIVLYVQQMVSLVCQHDRQHGMDVSGLFRCYLSPVFNVLKTKAYACGLIEHVKACCDGNMRALLSSGRSVQTMAVIQLKVASQALGSLLPKPGGVDVVAVDVTQEQLNKSIKAEARRLLAVYAKKRMSFQYGYISKDRQCVAQKLLDGAFTGEGELKVVHVYRALCEAYAQTLTDDAAKGESNWVNKREHSESRLRRLINQVRDLVVASATSDCISTLFEVELLSFQAMLQVAAVRVNDGTLSTRLAELGGRQLTDERAQYDFLFEVEALFRDCPQLDELAFSDIHAMYRHLFGVYELSAAAQQHDQTKTMRTFYQVNRGLTALETKTESQSGFDVTVCKQEEPDQTSKKSVDTLDQQLQTAIAIIRRQLASLSPNMQTESWHVTEEKDDKYTLTLDYSVLTVDETLYRNTLAVAIDIRKQQAVAHWPEQVASRGLKEERQALVDEEALPMQQEDDDMLPVPGQLDDLFADVDRQLEDAEQARLGLLDLSQQVFASAIKIKTLEESARRPLQGCAQQALTVDFSHLPNHNYLPGGITV